jgi:hypothetical protein
VRLPWHRSEPERSPRNSAIRNPRHTRVAEGAVEKRSMKCDAQPSSECACKANAVHGSAGQCRVAQRSTRVSQNLPDSFMPLLWSRHLGSDKHSAPRRFPIVFVLRCPITIESLELVDLLLASKASSLMCSTPRLIPVYRAGIRTLWSLAVVAVGELKPPANLRIRVATHP